MKRILAIVLVCMMLVALVAACNNNDSGTTPTPTPEGGTGTTATPAPSGDPEPPQRTADERLFGWVSNWHNYGLPLDPITIDVVVDQGVMRHPGPLNNLSDFMLQNTTGITLNFIGADEERFGVMIATGDLPEIVTNISSRPEVWADVINSGQVMDMTDLYNRFGDNLKTIYDGIPIGWINYWIDEWTDSSGLYFLTQGIRNLGDVKLLNVQTGGSGGLFVQNDIYYDIGMPPITGADGRFSEDAFIDVLVQMQDYARNERGLPNAWGYSGINWGANMFYVEFPYQFGITGFNTASYVNDQTNEYLPMFSDTSHPRWDGYRFFNRMHLAGVVDPEMFIIPWDAYEDKLHAGEIMYTYFTWTNDYYNFDNELAGGYPIPGVPVIWDIFIENDYIGHNIGGVRAINSNSPNAERIMAMFDYMVTDEYFISSNKHPLEGIL